MFKSSTVLPIVDLELTDKSKLPNYNWKTLTKAGLVFVTTTGAFLALKTNGSFNLIGKLLQQFKITDNMDGKSQEYNEDGMTSYDEGKLVNDQDFTTRELAQVSSSTSSTTPILVSNSLIVFKGETITLATSGLRATDADSDDTALIFIVDDIQHGRFEKVSNRGIPITTFPQQQIIDNKICFIHDGSEIAPIYRVKVSDGNFITEPSFASIEFESLTQSNEFRVNTYTNSAQVYPSIAGLIDNRFVIVWQSDIRDGDGTGIFGQIFYRNGTRFGSEFQVNTYTNSAQNWPDVISLENHGFLVTWESGNAQDGDSWGIFGQKYTLDGSRNGQEFQVNTYTTSSQNAAACLYLKNNKFVVTWHSYGQDGSEHGVYGQIFWVNGTKFGEEFRVNDYTNNIQGNTFHKDILSTLGLDKFVSTWGSFLQDGSNYGVYAKIYHTNGTTCVNEFQVNTYTLGWQHQPAVADLENGKFIIIWESRSDPPGSTPDQDGSDSGIFARFYDYNGIAYSDEFQINDYTTSNQQHPVVTYLGNNKFIAVWSSNGQDGSERGVYAKIYHNDGRVYKSEFRVNTYTLNGQAGHQVTAINDEEFVLTWYSDNQEGSSWELYSRIYQFKFAPILKNNNLTISKSERVTLTTNNLSATDADDDDNVLTFTVSNVQDGQFELKSNPGTPITSFTQQQIINRNIQFVHDGSANSPSYNIAVSDGSLSTSPLPAVVTLSFSESFQALSGTSNSETTTTGKSLLATILGSIGGIIGTITSILGLWLKYKRYRAINKLRQQSLLAAEVQRHLNLDVSDFQSKQGQRYVKIINGIVKALQEQGMSVEEMDKEELHNLTLRSVEVIKEEVKPKRRFWRKQIPIKGLKKAKAAIIEGVVDKYTEDKHKSGIKLKSIKSSRDTLMDETGTLNICLSIPYSELKIRKQLGSGASGIVYKGRWQHTNVAIKQLHSIEFVPGAKEEFIRETSIMANLRHSNIVQLRGVCLEPHYCIVMEFMEKGALFNVLQDEAEILPWHPIRWQIAIDISRGLAYLHSLNILHRDLKSLNVLLNSDMHAKLTDFGLSKIKTEMIKTMTQGTLGTPRWVAPELIISDEDSKTQKREYTKKADMYSYGIILNEIASRQIPFAEVENEIVVLQKITQGKRPSIPKDCPSGYAELITRCWSQRPEDRPDADEAVQILKTISKEDRRQTPAALIDL
jgi:tRNA A-37 threonylcarbamoyl transferase component Bud32